MKRGVSMAEVKLNPGWICKDNNSLWWTDQKPPFNTYFDPGEVSQWESRGHWRVMRNCIVDPWPDKPNGGPECILEVK